MLGDATKAYGPVTNEFWLDRFQKINVVPNEANGYGQRNITLYRRHYLQLEEGYVVIYDELEAENPVKWTTQFQVPYYTIESQKTANNKQQHFTVKTDVGLVNTSVFAHNDLKMQVHDQFAEPAVNWNKVTGADGKVLEYKNQWHAGITSVSSKKMRFLTLIQIDGKAKDTIKSAVLKNGILQLNFGNWQLSAQLNSDEAPMLDIKNEKLN